VSVREQLLEDIPVTERRLELAGVSTAVLEGGDGPSVVLLHEQGEFAASWMRVIPGLAETHRVIAPDLPGHGTSEVTDGQLDADRVFAWLGELIEQTCTKPPTLVGHMLGGAIAARFAIDQGDRLSRLVLVDTFGLAKFRPAPRFALALVRYLVRPTERSHDHLHRRCTADLDSLRDRMDGGWERFQAYALDRMRTPSVTAAVRVLMGKLGVPAIPSADLERIAVPTTLIWGGQDPVMRVKIAESASARYGWPLHVIENAGDVPALEQPEAFLSALHSALGTAVSSRVA
jgi:pimeloyl-ACP methyl ester carboxylesterase